MPRSANLDPLTKFEFHVFILRASSDPLIPNAVDSALALGGFQTCTSPEITVNTRTYYEGGGYLIPYHIVSTASFNEISIGRGLFIPRKTLQTQTQERFTAKLGKKEDTQNAPQTFADIIFTLFNVQTRHDLDFIQEYRYNILINHYRRDGSIARRYVIFNAIPIYLKPASDFDSMDDTGISIETLRFRYEGFDILDTDERAIGTKLKETILAGT